MSLKLDMSNAYDRVECNYFKCILRKLGFPTHIIDLIMQHIKTTSFSVLINRIPKEPIVLSKGLKQEDPLSPYLFLLYIEDLVNLLRETMIDQSIMDIHVCQGAPTIIHLLFAYENLIFCKANAEASNNLQRILIVYALNSGQCINTEKTNIVFNRNIDEVDKTEIAAM